MNCLTFFDAQAVIFTFDVLSVKNYTNYTFALKIPCEGRQVRLPCVISFETVDDGILLRRNDKLACLSLLL